MPMHANDFTENDWSVSFNKCKGEIIIKILYQHANYSWDDDAFYYMNLEYKKADGTWERFYMWEDSRKSSDLHGAPSYVNRNNTYHFRADTKHVVETVFSENNWDYSTTLYWRSMPADLYGGAINIRLSGLWRYNDYWWGAQKLVEYEKSAQTSTVAMPTALQASEDLCDTIAISWTAPNVNNCMGSYYVEVYVDNIRKGEVWKIREGEVWNGPNSYDFIDGNPGTERNIKIRTRYDFYGTSTNYSDFTTFVTGKEYGPLDPPKAVTASETNCDSTVTLGWQSTETPKYFGYQRSTSADFSTELITVDTITPDTRTIVVNVPTEKVSYYYRMFSINKCDDQSVYSSIVSGKAAGAPNAPTNFAVAEENRKLLLTWEDMSNDETGFMIIKTFDGNSEEIVLEADIEQYLDENVSICVSYNYEIFAKNDCATNGISGGQVTGLLSPDISDVFEDSDFKASKGYYPNRVQLTWDIESNVINNIKIYRRPEGSGENYSLLTTLNNNASIYDDENADGWVIYQYMIFGERNCNNVDIRTDTVYDIGFRNPYGIVNGHIEYEGGVAVEDVQVLVTRPTSSIGNALEFDGIDDYLQVPHSENLIGANAFSLQMYVNLDDPTLSHTWMVKGTSFSWRYLNGIIQFILSTETDNYQCNWTVNLSAGTYYQTTVIYNGTSLRLSIDGELIGEQAASGIVSSNTAPIIIGTNKDRNSAWFKGKMDEIRIFDRALSDSEIARDYVRMLNPNEDGLKAYWRMDEGVSTHIYDASKTGSSFNENHGEIHGATWTDVIPADAQLGLMGITDVNGDYTVSNIAYTGVGENFKLTPFLGQHIFSPGNIVLFIGEGATVHNNQDFADISSFFTSVIVRFEDERLDAFGDPLQTCYVKDCYVYIDGEMVINNGSPVQTDDTGKAEFTTPIGEHVISVGMPGHTFSPTMWPGENNPHDFQEDIINPITFVDETRTIMAGRVVGGTREGDKKIGFHKSVNNLGQAKIILRKQGNACWRDTVLTDFNSGEYTAELPPMKFEVESIIFPTNLVLDLGPYDLIDLTPNFSLITLHDTTDVGGQEVITDFEYHYRNDYIHRTDPSITVTQPDRSPIVGEETYTFVNLADDSEVDIPLGTKPFGYPVFLSNGHYDTRISVFEKYINTDTNTEDLVPVTDGTITINNSLGKSADIGSTTDQEIIEMSEADGDTLYTFIGGLPNILYDNTNPNLSFTQTFELTVKIGERNPIVWQPNGETFRGFIVGGKPKGSNFTTNGPEVVDMILRDPPGSNSHAYLAKGSSMTHLTSFSLGMSGSSVLEATTKVGLKMEIGGGITGPAIETEIKVNDKATMEASFSITADGYYNSTFTTMDKWSTNSSSELVGAPEDIFIGQSMNFTYGLTDNVGIMPTSSCTQGGGSFTCSDTEIMVGGQGYRLGKKIGMFVVPEGFETQFSYSQDHIENYLIPDLVMLRNGLLERGDGVYVSAIVASHQLYGTNNDDPVWGAAVSSADSTKTVVADYSGASYTFDVPVATSNNDVIVDSIRWYNQQIRLWEEAMARNEQEKLEAELDRNLSFDAGTTYEYSQTTTHTGGWSNNYEVGVGSQLEKEVSAEIGGAGAGFKYTLKMDQTTKTAFGGDYSNSTSYGYVIDDKDQGDFFSVEVRKPQAATGPVFKTAGGQSMCPWEGEILTKYYKPGAVLSIATMRREVPTLSVSPAIASDVPADEAARYTVMIGNESESDDVMWYKMRVIESTNPFGASISIDGKSIERIYEVPPGVALTKVMTLTRAPGHDNYEGIKIIIYSPCEWDHHMNGGIIQAVDTISISAHFVPACTDINIAQPQDKWVLNYADNNLMNMVFDGYERSYSEFGHFEIQYRPLTENQWTILEKFFVDTTGLNDPDARQIPATPDYTQYEWDLTQMIDGGYEIRAVTQCLKATDYAPIHTGLIDRVNPHSFASPQPADGILSLGDEIMIEFNETIHEALLSWSNFDIRGVVNGTELTHGTSLFFDGTNEQYMNVREGINLQSKSISVELWIKRNNTGEACVLSQGTSSAQGFSLGFDATDHFRCEFAGYSLSTDEVWTGTGWMHFVCTYNYETGMIYLYKDGSLLKSGNSLNEYTGSGQLLVGKRSYGDPIPFEGKVHDLRIWSTVRNQALIVENMNIRLSGHERGLFANWHMDEAFGDIAKDVVHYRNADVHATWSIEPAGKAIAFDGADDCLELDAALVSFHDEMDFTLEFWFKGADRAKVGLLGNGKGLAGGGNPTGWCISTDINGTIQVLNEGLAFNAADAQYWDNQWHHFALVVSRIGNMHAYVDGQLQNSTTSSGWSGFGGGKIWVGCRGWYDGAQKMADQFFTGEIDEVRVWNTARKRDQIERYMNHRLEGNEFGLKAYYPFETYSEVAGVPLLTASMQDCTEGSALSANSIGGANYTNVAPNIKLQHPVQQINFQWAVQDNRIVMVPTDPPGVIENVILDITVKGVSDMHGNVMQSPVTWTAYVDHNQVTWEQERINHDKKLFDPLSFTTTLVNKGGTQQEYSIENLPDWITAVPRSGTLQPMSTTSVQFIVSESVPIGKYSFDAHLQTDFHFDEKLLISINVFAEEPDWSIDPDAFQYSMNLVGELSVEGVISSDPNDMVAAFVEDTCRGVAYLKYIEDLDRHEVFLDIYSNTITGENIDLRVWNASEGKIHMEVTPDLVFLHNDIYGSTLNPIHIAALNTYEQVIPLPLGWRWISFNLATNNLTNPDSILWALDANPAYLVKGQGLFDAFSESTGWTGTISLNGGFQQHQMYMFYSDQADTIHYIGSKLDPGTVNITLNAGWNWVGYTPDMPMEINEALGYFAAEQGDFIKAQNGFSEYVDQIGWIGSLEYLTPGKGYKIRVNTGGGFTYPSTGFKHRMLNKPDEKLQAFDLFELDMRIIGMIELPNGVMPDQLIKAWAGDQLCGIGEFVWIPEIQHPICFLTIHGNIDDINIRFTLENKDSEEGKLELAERIRFKSDAITGSAKRPFEFHLSSDVNEDRLMAYPNPFSHEVNISFELAEKSVLKIIVYNTVGQQIRILGGATHLPGKGSIKWNGKNQFGQTVPDGIYYLRMETKMGSTNQRIVKINNY